MRAGKALTGRKGIRFVGLITAVAITAFPTISPASEEGGNKTVATKSKGVSARMAAGGTVEINGWATFSGQQMAGHDDPKEDGKNQAGQFGAEMIESNWTYRPENEDFFIRWEVTKIPTVGGGPGGLPLAGIATTMYGFKFGVEGDSQKSFEVRAQSLGGVPKDPTNPRLPTQAAFGLFECSEASGCVEVAELKGGYGTTGERIVTALPVKVLSDALGTQVKEGDAIEGFYAFTANAPFIHPTPVAQELIYDDIRVTEKPQVEIPKKSVTLTVKKTTVEAELKDGYFKATFPAKLFSKSKPTKVTSKTCLGEDCVTQTFMVQPSSS